MQRYRSAAALIKARRPEKPVLALRPHAAGRAARWFRQNFDGDIAYACLLYTSDAADDPTLV